MRIPVPPITASCATCSKSYTRSWFRLNQRSEYCSVACRKFGAEIRAGRSRMDRLMALYASTAPEYIRDMYLTMADSECARMKILTRWDEI